MKKYHLTFPDDSHQWYTEEQLREETQKYILSSAAHGVVSPQSVVKFITGAPYHEDVLNVDGLFVIQYEINRIMNTTKGVKGK